MKVKKILACLSIIVLISCYFTTNTVYAADKSVNYNELTYQWKFIKTSMPDNPSGGNMQIQNFSKYNNMFFTTQQYNGNTYVSRCMATNISRPDEIRKVDYIILSGYGHGESIEVTDYDASTNTYSIWIGSTANSNSGSYCWSTTVTRIKYQVDSSSATGALCTEFKKITSIPNAAGVTLNPYRVSVSVAESDNRICFSSQVGTKSGSWYFIIYSLSEITKALNNIATNNSASLSSLGVTPKSVVSITDAMLPNDSFQAQDIDGVGSNSKFLFISGGSTSVNAKIKQFLYTNGNNISLSNTYIFKTLEAPSTHFLYQAEIEGVKIYNDTMFILFKKNGSCNGEIYSYPVS